MNDNNVTYGEGWRKGFLTAINMMRDMSKSDAYESWEDMLITAEKAIGHNNKEVQNGD